MGWVKAKWISRLVGRFDALWPGRTRAQDGSIGDTAHQSSPSAHNPDDTPGSRPEREDADNKAEVRGADVDARGVPMQRVIDQILADPEQRKRFIYIIFNGQVWSAAYGWIRRIYTGPDKHLTHAHFSGDPAYDEDDRPFTFGASGATPTTPAATPGDDVDLTDKNVQPVFQGDPGGQIVPPGTDLTVGQMLAYTYQHAYYARQMALQQRAAIAAEVTRDATTQAALTAISRAITAAGGAPLELTPVMAAIQAAADGTRGMVEQLQQDLHAVRTENAALRSRLAAAFGPGSE